METLVRALFLLMCRSPYICVWANYILVYSCKNTQNSCSTAVIAIIFLRGLVTKLLSHKWACVRISINSCSGFSFLFHVAPHWLPHAPYDTSDICFLVNNSWLPFRSRLASSFSWTTTPTVFVQTSLWLRTLVGTHFFNRSRTSSHVTDEIILIVKLEWWFTFLM